MPGVSVWARVHLTGFHRWPGATGEREYLAARHRHEFIIRADVATTAGDDRIVEFHDLAGLITAWWGPPPRECGAASCETIARQLARYLTAAGLPPVAVDVSEDGQAGATYRPGEGL